MICLLLTPLLFALTRSWEQALPNPLALGSVVISLQSDYLLLALWLANAMSMMLLAFNLLPMFPLDGGRVLQNILWMRMATVARWRSPSPRASLWRSSWASPPSCSGR